MIETLEEIMSDEAAVVLNPEAVEKSEALIARLRSVRSEERPEFEFEDALANIVIETTKLKKFVVDQNKDDKKEKAAKTVMIRRIFVESLITSEQEYRCNLCPSDRKAFKNFKSLRRHQNKDHPDNPEKFTAGDILTKNSIICLMENKNMPGKLCKKKVPRNDITRHLSYVHGIQRPQKKQFKGFFSFDGEKSFSVAWGERKEQFSEESIIEMEVSGSGQEAENTQEDGEEETCNLEENILGNVDSDEEAIMNTQETPDEVEAEIIEERFTDDSQDSLFDSSVDIKKVQSSQMIMVNNQKDVFVEQVKKDLVSKDGDEMEIMGSEDANDSQNIQEEYEQQQRLRRSRRLQQKDLALAPAPHDQDRDAAPAPPPAPAATQDTETMETNNDAVNYVSVLKKDVLLSRSVSKNEEDYEIFDVVDFPKDAFASSFEFPALKSVDIGLVEVNIDDGDPQNLSSVSRNMKEDRHLKRMLLGAIERIANDVKNEQFINKFNNWLDENASGSTKSFKNGHLFYYPDSFLNYFTSLYQHQYNKAFNLMQLLAFQDEESFVSVPSPVSWLAAIGGRSAKEFPQRRDECVKAFKNLVKFINSTLNENNFDAKSIVQKRAIKEHLKDITDLIEEKNYHKNFKKLAESKNIQRKQMTEIVEPINEEDKVHSLEKWFESDESQDIAKEAETIWRTAVRNGSISKKDFNRFSSICFLELALSDKLRVGVYYSMNNRDWTIKKEVYLPAGYEDPNYDALPSGWKIYEKPNLQPNAKPSRYEIRIPGDRPGLKNKQRQVITLNLRIYEIMERYQDLKRLLFTSLDLESPFFVNYNNSSLPPLKNYDGPGSLLRLVEKVTGIKNFTLKDTRKSLDSQIQNKESLKPHMKALNSHSLSVGSTYYDELDGARRTLLNNSINKKEGSDLKRVSSEVDDDVKAKRARNDQVDKQLLINQAEEYLQNEKKRKPKDLSPSALSKEDVTLLSDLFKNDVEGRYIRM